MITFVSERLEQTFPHQLQFEDFEHYLTITVAKDLLFDLCKFLATNQELNFSILKNLFSYDSSEANQSDNDPLSRKLIYHIYSRQMNLEVFIKVALTDNQLPSLIEIWKNIGALEREQHLRYDLNFSLSTKQPDNVLIEQEYSLGPGRLPLPLPLEFHLSLKDSHITKAVIYCGQAERGFSNLIKNLEITDFTKLLGTIDTYCGPAAQMAFLLSIEKHLKIEIPRGAALIRVLILELAKIALTLSSYQQRLHLLGLHTLADKIQPKLILILKMMTSMAPGGKSLTYIRLGGFSNAPTNDWCHTLQKELNSLLPLLEKQKSQLENNFFLYSRLKDLGRVSDDLLTDFNLHKDYLNTINANNWEHNSDAFDFSVENGDSYQRLFELFSRITTGVQLVLETIQAVQEQNAFCCKNMPLTWEQLDLHNTILTATINGPTGPMTIDTVFDDQSRPLNFSLRGASFFKLALIEQLLADCQISDLGHLLASWHLAASELEFY